MEDQEEKFLYRFEYYDTEDNDLIVQWLWLEEIQVFDFIKETGAEVRKATKDEENLYNEAYFEGYAKSAISEYDGITFAVQFDGDGNLDMNGKKMFQCCICDRHLDFEENVSSAGGMYLGAIRDDKLWHICYDCARGSAEVDWIEQGWVWDN